MQFGVRDVRLGNMFEHVGRQDEVEGGIRERQRHEILVADPVDGGTRAVLGAEVLAGFVRRHPAQLLVHGTLMLRVVDLQVAPREGRASSGSACP